MPEAWIIRRITAVIAARTCAGITPLGSCSRISGPNFTRYTTGQGLVTNMVYNLVEDDQGFLWFGSASGLVRVSKSALNDYAAGKSKYIFSTLQEKLTDSSTWTLVP